MPHVLVHPSLCSLQLNPVPTTLLLRSASHVENHDAAALQLNETQQIYTSSACAYNGSQRNLYEHDAAYSNPSQYVLAFRAQVA